MSLESKAAGLKNGAVGVAILAALAALAYLGYKTYKGAAAVGQAATHAGGYLFGASPTSTLGTDIYDWVSPSTDLNAIDEAQAIKTCNLLLAQNGTVKGPICQRLLAQGKLDAGGAAASYVTQN